MPQRLTYNGAGWQGVAKLAGGMCLLLAGLLVAQEQGSRQPIPSKEQQQKSQALVDDIFKEDFQRADTPEKKARLAAYQREYHDLELESRELGGEVLRESFGVVRDMFYDILVRTDVGIIDIAWAQREFADKTLKALDRDKKREQRTLRVDFDQVLREEEEAKARAHQERAKDQPQPEAPDDGTASHHTPTTAMNAGSTMTSRDIHDVRHISTARHARSLLPRCRNDDPSATSSSTKATPRPTCSSGPPGARPASTDTASATTSPCALPASVVKKTIEKAGFIRPRAR